MIEAEPGVRRTPVMADVARLAGVSHQTVSRVINGQDNLRPATREKVEEAIRQLGYRPNTAARALVTRKSATIGVIGSKSGYWGPSTVHRTIQAAGRDAGYFVSSVNLQSMTREELVDAIDQHRVHAEGRQCLFCVGDVAGGEAELAPALIAATVFALISGLNGVLSGLQNAARQREVVAWHRALEQWLRRVPDDPGGLLRRKFQYETNQRLRRGDYGSRETEKIW